MRHVNTGMVIVMASLLILMPLGFPSAESVDELKAKGYRTLSDEEVCAKYGWHRQERKKAEQYVFVPGVDSSSGGTN